MEFNHEEAIDMDIVPLNEDRFSDGSATYRHVAPELTPEEGQEFANLEKARDFYMAYAKECGFDIRNHTTKRNRKGIVIIKEFVCNKEGFARSVAKSKNLVEDGKIKVDAEGDKRTVKLTRVGCKAKVKLLLVDGVYKVEQFLSGHNHELVEVNDREFLKSSRNLTAYHKELIVSNYRIGIGATKTYRICKESAKGSEYVGAQLNDFKNFQRDLKCFIGQQDGQLFIDHFKTMAETRAGFYFDYVVDGDGALLRAFWSDAIARRNYDVCGDAVSFDPTYGTNKYLMYFTPFTGVDNHKKIITFAGGLTKHEDDVSFEWLFSRFLDAMGGKEPAYIITDQATALISSVPKIFKTARHRLCMWHIMNKVPTKFGGSRSDFSIFIKKLNDIIWDEHLEPTEFDSRWREIMEDHEVDKKDWFDEIFSMRTQWVLAHCKDLKMGGIMKTTQRSESVNSFFKRFEDKSGTLVEFTMRFESAIDQQRHNQKKLDNESRQSAPKMISHLAIEKDAARVYTHSIFFDFQHELKQSMSTCSVAGYCNENGVEITIVRDADNGRNYEVQWSAANNHAECTCRLFHTKGIMCRHILWNLSGKGVRSIPLSSVSERWTKDAFVKKMYDSCARLTEEVSILDGRKKEMSKLWSEFYSLVGLLGESNLGEIESLCTLIKEFKENLLPIGEPLSKEQEIEKFLGCTSSKEVLIMPPKKSVPKGRISGKRMVSNKEKAVEVSLKGKRLCGYCKKMSTHDRRTCPILLAQMEAEKKATEELVKAANIRIGARDAEREDGQSGSA